MLNNTIGIIIKLAFDNVLIEKLFAIILGTIKNKTIYKYGVFLKYINFNSSEKFLSVNSKTSIINIIERIPIVVFSSFPPRNSEMSNKSFPINFLNIFHNIKK